MNEKEIRAKLTSEDGAVLGRALLFVDNRLLLIRDRAKLAETRTTTILAVSGIMAGFVVNFGKILFSPEYHATPLSSALFLLSIILLIKAIVFSVKALWVLKGYELTPELAFDFQSMSEIDTLKEELTWKIWEYWKTLPMTTERLFWLNRAQRNTVVAILTFLSLGVNLLVEMKFGFVAPKNLAVVIIIILASLVICIDLLMERLGSVWHT